MSLLHRHSWRNQLRLFIFCFLAAQQVMHAAPPPAASNIRGYTTRDLSQNPVAAWWQVTWQDNALDEAGYIVRFRYLLRGRPVSPYFLANKEAANTTSSIFSLREFPGLSPDYSLQFQVQAYKNNGARVETSTATSQRVNFLAGTAFNKPENFAIAKVPGSDGLYDLDWTDTSSTEIYHLLSYKEPSSSTWREAQISLFGENDIRRAISLKPGVAYQFRLRYQRFSSPTTTDYSNIIQLTTEALAAPTNLGVTVLNNATARLNWNDNSDNAMGYEIQFRADENDNFEPLTSTGGGIFYLGGNDTSYEIEVPRGSTYQWRVRAVYQESTDQSLHYSAFSNVASSQTTFAAPSNVVAVPTGLAGSVAVKWSYAGTEATQFQILRRAAGSSDDFTSVQVVQDTTKEVFLTGLTVGTEIEIGVRALGSNGATSAITEAVPVTPQHGFDPNWYVGNLDPDTFGLVLLTPLRETGVQVGGGPGGPDADEDGIPDANDSHPSNDALWCDWNNNGTNDNLDTIVPDSDGDGVADNYDSHPNNASLWADWNGNDTNDFQESSGGVNDSDNDGVENLNDSHPDNPNLWSDWNNNGSNDNLDSPIPDEDNDRVRDSKDSDPQNPALWTDWNDNGINNHDEDFQVQDNFIAAHDVKVGTAFTSELAVTNDAAVATRALTDLPGGLNFSDTTGGISGIPNASGIVRSVATVTYTGGASATARLVFRVQPATSAPQTVATLPNRTIGTGLTFNLPLSGFFKDPDNPRTVRLTTNLGAIDLALFEEITPQTVASFMAYVNAGDYNNVAFQRSVPGFILQGGSTKPSTAPDEFVSVPSRASPRNEPGIGNIRGTIAYAKVGSDPNSATTDFFLNLSDNRENLDVQNRGFTVFGKVIGSTMSVVDAIAALPTNKYEIELDGEPIRNTNPLDNNTLYNLWTWPMNDTTAPATMDISKTVRITNAAEVSPLAFSVQQNSAPAVLTATVNGSQLSLTGLAAGTSVLTLRATDYDGSHVEQTFTVEVVNGHVHPAITAQPQNQSVAPGGQASFTVTAEGSGLNYVWRKDGTPLAVQPGGPTLTLNTVSTANEGAYDVVISNATTSVTSATATLLVTETAAIVADLSPRIITSGQPLVLTLQVQGKPAPQVAWFKNNQPLTQTGPVLTIPTATLADHGLYRAVVTNSSGSVNSATVPVVVVDGGTRRFIVKQGANTSLNVVVAQPPGLTLTYQWRNGQNQNLTQGGRFDGVTRPRLNLKSINLIEGPDLYTCVVSGPGAMGSATSGTFDVIVSTVPAINAITDLPTAVVGQEYSHTVAINSTKAQTPTTFTFTGLPRGLQFDRVTGRIFGFPLIGGTFRVRMIASNPAGPSPAVTANLRVIPMPTNTTGQFVGLIERQAEVNAMCGGRLDLDVTDNAAFSAKLTLSTGVHRLKGPVTRSVQTISNQSVTVITGTGVLKRRNLPDATLRFTLNANTGNLSGELRLDDTKKAALTGWKNIWHKTFRPTSDAALAGAYHFGMTIPTASVGNATIPQGKGYGRLTVSDSGIASLSGRSIDNKPVLMSAPLGPAGSFIVFQLLYQNKGSLLGPLGISLQDANFFGGLTHAEVNRVSGFTFDQYKPAQPIGTRDYPAGFTSPVSLTVTGGNYTQPDAKTGSLNAIARLAANGALDNTFGSPVQANQAILCMRAQNDQILIGGLFSAYNNKPAPNFARLNANGTLDESFNAGGSGPNGVVYGIALDSNDKILIVGDFSTYNGTARGGVARLNANGTLDTTFNPGTGANDVVECVAVQSDGAVIIGGRFGSVAGSSRPGIARLNANGALDAAFTPGTGANNTVRCLAIQPTDQKILIGGDFTSFNGTGRVRIARLNTNGTLDTTFNPSAGANASVLAMVVQSDNRILIGGAFTTYNSQSRNRVALLETGGPLSSTTLFNPGTAANGEVRTLAIRSDGKILIGGFFNRYNSTSDNTNGVALLSATGALETAFAPTVSADNRNNVRALLSLSSNQVVIGGWVWSRIRTDRILGLNDSQDKARVDFAEGKLDLFPVVNPDATFILSDKNRPTAFGSNPGGTTFSYNASTGIISGRTTVRSATTSRTVNYTSLLIPMSPSDYRALGGFDLAEPPDGLSITNANAPIHTGSVEISPAP